MAITDKTRKLLWGASGKRCALCRCELIVEGCPEGDPKAVVGDECHIISQQAAGPRAGGDYPIESIDDYANLILLCKTDHKVVDDQPEKFTAKALRNLKIAHENWVHACLRPLADGDKFPKVAIMDRILSGKNILTLLDGVCSIVLDHDEPHSGEEVELLKNFLQEIQDWTDCIGDIDSGERVSIAFDLTGRIKTLEENGFCVFGLAARSIERIGEKKNCGPQLFSLWSAKRIGA